MPAQTIAHIVGIALMSTQLSPNHHLQTIIPKIPNDYAGSIEAHVAFIAFDARALADHGKEWTPTAFPKVNGMQWIRLNGDRVVITVEGAVDNKRMVSAPLDLPKITNCCPGATIRKEFAPPAKGMPRANEDAAIIDFPTAYEAHGCNGHNGRADTLVTLRSSEFVRLSAGPKKWIRLRAGSEFYIANAPKQYIEGSGARTNAFMQHDTSTAHYNVYYGMIDAPGCLAWLACATAPSHPCKASFVTLGHDTSPPGGTWGIMDINCSDSQYP